MASIFTQFLKKDTKKPLHGCRKQGGFQKRNSLLIFDALMQRLLHLFYPIHQITNYATPYYEDFRYSFLLLFKQFYITKKIRRIMPDFLDFLYFVCEQKLLAKIDIKLKMAFVY